MERFGEHPERERDARADDLLESAAHEHEDDRGPTEAHGRPRSRVSVVDEQPPRPAPPRGATEEEYRWHSYKVYPSGRPDAVEFVDVYK